jgi:shikimate kinase
MIITLMGYMGSGKSTLGKKLAKKIQAPFVDLDMEIEKKEDKSIEQIFNEKGEAYFRKIESAVLSEILGNGGDVVLSLGGGTPCFNNNLMLIKKMSTSIYIKLPAITLVQRLNQSNKNIRPLIANLSQSELLPFIEQQLTEREEFYSKADYIYEPLKETYPIWDIFNQKSL